MELDDFIKLALSVTFLSIGTIFSILRNKFFSEKHVGTLHYSFLGFAILVFLGSVIGCSIYWDQLFTGEGNTKYFEVIVLLSTIVVAISLFFTVKVFLQKKNVYKTSELDPIVKEFTSMADLDEIKLFGGDLNFFGSIPSDMDDNNQYNHLRSLSFKRVLIICEAPKDQIQRIRYGKILSDMPSSELRFYDPDSADLKVRGRIIQVQGSDRLLMYSKIKSKTYRAIETDTSGSEGALYDKIWDLVWSMATQPSQQEINSYKIS